ncbi:putative membrane protein [Rhodococcus sp. UYP5]
MTTSVRLRPTAALRTAPEPRLAVPRVATSLIVGGMVAASLAPGLLPRSSLTQALVTGVMAALGLGLSAGLHRLLRRLVPVAPQCGARRVAAAASVVSVALAGVAAARWQSSLRSSMGMPAASRLHWVEVLCGSVSVSAILIVLFLATTRGYLRLGRVKAIVMLTVLLIGSYFIAVPMAFSSLAERSAVANSLVDISLPIPNSRSRSGSAASLITWNDLGREGRIFAAGGTDISTVRAYIGVQASTDVEARAELAVRELDRAGGFDRSHIVVAVPTGSGWIDENAVTGLETRFDGDVATVAAQYHMNPVGLHSFSHNRWPRRPRRHCSRRYRAVSARYRSMRGRTSISTGKASGPSAVVRPQRRSSETLCRRHCVERCGQAHLRTRLPPEMR